MRTFSTLFSALILNSFFAYSQKDYAVSIKGDTLKGKIKMYSYDNLDRIVELYNACLQGKTEVLMKTKVPQTTSVDTEKIAAVTNFIEKIEAENFLTKKDVMDVLRDIKSKVSTNEKVPNYLTDSLKSY